MPDPASEPRPNYAAPEGCTAAQCFVGAAASLKRPVAQEEADVLVGRPCEERALGAIGRAAEAKGFITRRSTATVEDLPEHLSDAEAAVTQSHHGPLLVLRRNGQRVEVVAPCESGERTLTLDDLGPCWTGGMLVLGSPASPQEPDQSILDGIDKLDVLYIADVPLGYRGGAEISMANLLSALTKKGYRVAAVRLAGTPVPREAKQHPDLLMPTLSQEAVEALAKRTRPAAVFSQLFATEGALAASRAAEVPLFLFVRSTAEHFCDNFRRGRKEHVCRDGGPVDLLHCDRGCLSQNDVFKRNQALFRGAAEIVCNSDYMRKAVWRFYRRHGVVHYPLICPDGSERPSELATRPFLTVVRPTAGKGADLINALAERFEGQILCIGRNDVRPRYNVVRVGELEDLSAVWARSRIHLKPVRNIEAFGRTCAEAGLWGVPSIATRTGGLPESVGDGGILLDQPDDVDSCLEAIGAIEADYQSCSAAAVENARQFQDVTTVERLLEKFLRSAQSRTSRPRPAASRKVASRRRPVAERKQRFLRRWASVTSPAGAKRVLAIWHRPTVPGFGGTPQGGEQGLQTILNYLNRTRGDVCLVITGGDEKRAIVDGVRVWSHPDGIAAPDARDLIRYFQPDAAILGGRDAVRASETCRELGVPYILYVQSFFRLFGTGGTAPHNMLERPFTAEDVAACVPLFENAARIVTLGPFSAGVIKRYYGRDSEIALSPVDRAKVGVTEFEPLERRYITCIDFDKYKGSEIVTEIARQMPEERFLAVAYQEARSPLPNLEIASFTDDVRSIYAKTRILLYPTHDLAVCGPSRVVFEALGNRIPCVVHRAGDLGYGIGDGGKVLSVESGIEDWVAAIREIDANYEQFSAAAGRQMDDYDADQELDKIAAIIDEISSPRQSPAAPRDDAGPLAPTDAAESLSTQTGRGEQEPTDQDVLLLSQDFPGVRSGFRFLEQVLPQCRFEEFRHDVDTDAACIVLGGWHSDYEGFARSHDDKIVAVKWCSNLAQSEMSEHEPQSLMHVVELLKQEVLDYLLLTDRHSAEAISHHHEHIRWWPDVLPIIDVDAGDGLGDGFHVDLFLAPSSRKNVMTQLAAARMAGARVHINGFFDRYPTYQEFARFLGLDVVKHDFLPTEDFHRLLASMQAGLQCTFAETFNYAAAEHMMLRVPALGSRLTPCMQFADQELRDALWVDDLGNVREIADKLNALKDPDHRRAIGENARKHIVRVAEERNRIAAEILAGILTG